MRVQKLLDGLINFIRYIKNFTFRVFFTFGENLIFKNYQLLIESYSFGKTHYNQEIELLSLELETQIMNMNISCLLYHISEPTRPY